MRTRHVISKLLRLPRAEWADLVVAQVALLGAWLSVAARPRGRLVGMAGARSEIASAAPDECARTRARGLALAVNRVAAHGVFRPQCLVRAVALKSLLDTRGLFGSRVQIGVRSQGGAFAAHAWVEYGSEILGDKPEHVRSFAPLSDLTVLEAR